MEILEYIMKTPENTNPNILKEMLQDIQGSSDSPYLVATLQENQDRGSFSTGAVGDGVKLDYSYDELLQAFNSGKIVLIYDSSYHLGYVAYIQDNNIRFDQYEITPDNTIIFSTIAE